MGGGRSVPVAGSAGGPIGDRRVRAGTDPPGLVAAAGVFAAGIVGRRRKRTASGTGPPSPDRGWLRQCPRPRALRFAARNGFGSPPWQLPISARGLPAIFIVTYSPSAFRR